MRIKKGDNCIVIAGADKGKTGTVARALPKREAVIIEGVNMRKKHQRPRRSNQKGQVLERAMPLHVSNVMLIDPKTDKPTRISIKRTDGKRIRVAKSGAEL
jgi:large subunit ribosomal protein L24